MQSQKSVNQNSCQINKYNNPILTKINLKIAIKDQSLRDPFYFDYFQHKIAFTTLDGCIKIYVIQQQGNIVFAQNLDCEFKAHQGKINSLSWSCPKFGNLIATCGEDQTVRIWQENAQNWRNISSLSKIRPHPLEVEWVENLQILTIAYSEGWVQFRKGPELQLSLEQQIYKTKFINFDIKEIDDCVILASFGQNDNTFSFDVFKLVTQIEADAIELKYQIILQESVVSVKIAPYICKEELRMALQFPFAIVIVTFEFENNSDLSLKLINEQSVELQQECISLQWSILGNEIIIYGEECTKVYQLNVNNDFVLI